MAELPSVERRLIVLLAAIAGVAVAGMLAIVPYRLYERDIRTAEVNAHRVATVVHAALSRSVDGGEGLTDSINRFQGIADAEISVEKLAEGEAHPAASARRGSSTLRGTDLTYFAPPILGPSGEKTIVSMAFDLSPMKRSSVRLIIDLVIAVVLGSLAFSLAVFFLIRGSLVAPLRAATASVERFAQGGGALALPEFHTAEMRDLAVAIERACATRGAKV